MKAFTFLFAVALIATIQALEFTEETKNRMREDHKECFKQSGFSETDIKRINNYPLQVDDERIRIHFVCIGKKINYLNEDGTLNTEEIKKKLHLFKTTDEQIEKIIKDCTTKKDSNEETMVHYMNCEHGILGKFDI